MIAFVVWFFALIIIIFVSCGRYITKLIYSARNKKIKEYCKQNGLTYYVTNSLDYGRLQDFELLSGSLTENFMTGKRGNVSFTICDLYKIDSSSKVRAHYNYTTLIYFFSYDIDFPYFIIRRKNLIRKFLTFIFDLGEIKFEDDYSFSLDYILKGTSKSDLKEFFTKNVRNVFLDNYVRGFSYEANQYYFLIKYEGIGLIPEIPGIGLFPSVNKRMELFEKAAQIYIKLIDAMPKCFRSSEEANN